MAASIVGRQAAIKEVLQQSKILVTVWGKCLEYGCLQTWY